MKNFHYIIFIIFFFVVTNSFSQVQPLAWVETTIGSSVEVNKDIKVDTLGNTYSIGTFYDLTDFDSGIGTYTLQPSVIGNTSMFIQKFDKSGNLLWARQVSGTGVIEGNTMYVNEDGDIFITGYFQNTIDFDPSPSLFNLSTAGVKGAYILKLDKLGNFNWVKSIFGSADCIGNSIFSDKSGNITLCGSSMGTIDFDPGVGTYTVSSNGGEDIFVVKLSNTGNFIWAKTSGGTLEDVAKSLACDASCNVIITGYFKSSSVDFDPGPLVSSYSTLGLEDIFIQKLDSNGNLIWIKTMGGIYTEIANSLKTDRFKNIYLTGRYNSPIVDFDPGPGTYTLGSSSASWNNAFIEKLDSTSNLIWVKGFGGNTKVESVSLSVDTAGNVYTCGNFNTPNSFAQTDFDPGPAYFGAYSVSYGYDFYIHKLNSSGNFMWAKPGGAASADYGKSVFADKKGSVYFAGEFGLTVDFEFGPATYTISSTAVSVDAFVLKFGCPNMPPVIITPTSNLLICSGSSTTLSVNGFYNLGWFSSVTGGTMLGSGNTFATPLIYSNTSFYVQDSISSSCKSERSAITVTIIPAPIFTVSASSNSICAGQTATLNISGASSSYTWNPGNLNGNNIIVNPVASTTYSVVGTSTSTGCNGTNTLNLNVVNCTSGFTVGFSLSNSICVGSSANVIANTGTTAVTGYTWTSSPAGPTFSGPNNANTSITFPSIGNYTIVLFAKNGASVSSTSNSITVSPNPTVTSTGPTWAICPPPTSQGMINCTAYGAATYTWQPGNVIGSVLNLWPYPSVSTTYSVTGTATNGCTSFTTQYVQVLPQVNIIVTAPPMACDGSSVCFTESAGDLVVWVWNDGCGNTISSGPFACFTASLGCGNTFTIGGNNMSCMNYITFSVNISTCTGINQLEVNNFSFELSPNPVTESLHIKTSSDGKENTQLELTDISGRIIYKSKCNFNSENIYSIDVSEFSSGVYFARIISEDKTSQPIKIIKE